MEAPAVPADLTIQERILIHLTGHGGARERYAVPKEVTQIGIAAALGVRAGHISREVHKLIEDGLVEERESAVEGSKRHQKAYFLTHAGNTTAGKLTGERAVKDAAALTRAHRSPANAGAPVRIADGLPEPRYFYGREVELEQSRRALDERAVVVVSGIAGIGKSTFGAKLFDEVSKTRPSSWHSVREYESPCTILTPVARLLASLGRPRLEVLIKREGPVDLARARQVLVQDAAGLRVAAFFDDTQAAGPEALLALRVLREVACEQPADFKLVLLGRSRPPIYDARDVALRKTVAELELEGLGADAVAQLVGLSAGSRRAEQVFEITGGHPLFVELVRDAEAAAPGARGGRRHIDRFLNEEIFARLAEGELDALRRASFVRRPVAARVVLGGAATFRDLHSLEQRSLVRSDARGRVSMHESIRDFVRRTLTDEEQRHIGQTVLDALLEEAKEAHRQHNAAYGVDLIESALAIVPDEAQLPWLLAQLAEDHFELTQYAQASARGQEALELVRKSGQGPSPVSLLLLLGGIHNEAAHAGSAKRFLDEAELLLSASPLPSESERGRLCRERGNWNVSFGKSSVAREWLDRALEVAHATGDAGLEATAELLYSHLTPAAESHERLSRCIAKGTEAGLLPMVSFAHSTFSWHLIHYSGQISEALEHARAGLETAEAIDNRALVGWGHVALAKALWRSGNYADAAEQARVALQMSERHASYELFPLYLMSLIQTDSGDAAAGERIGRDLLQLAEEFDWIWAQIGSRRALANALEAQGRIEEALPLFQAAHEAYSVGEKACDAGGDAVIVERLVDLEAARGNDERARFWSERLERLLVPLDDAVAEAFRAMARGHRARVARPSEAAADYGNAASRWRKLGWLPYEARLLASALQLARAGRQAGAPWPEGLAQESALEARIAEVGRALGAWRSHS